MPLAKKIGAKALKTQLKWGCIKVPCPFYHTTPWMRREKGWEEAHDEEISKLIYSISAIK